MDFALLFLSAWTVWRFRTPYIATLHVIIPVWSKSKNMDTGKSKGSEVSSVLNTIFSSCSKSSFSPLRLIVYMIHTLHIIILVWSKSTISTAWYQRIKNHHHCNHQDNFPQSKHDVLLLKWMWLNALIWYLKSPGRDSPMPKLRSYRWQIQSKDVKTERKKKKRKLYYLNIFSKWQNKHIPGQPFKMEMYEAYKVQVQSTKSCLSTWY